VNRLIDSIFGLGGLLVPISAILVGGVIAITAMIIRHNERIAKIERGIDPTLRHEVSRSRSCHDEIFGLATLAADVSSGSSRSARFRDVLALGGRSRRKSGRVLGCWSDISFCFFRSCTSRSECEVASLMLGVNATTDSISVQ